MGGEYARIPASILGIAHLEDPADKMVFIDGPIKRYGIPEKKLDFFT